MTVNGEHFWGRKHLIDEIGRGANTPQPTSFSLVGARLSGKSALLRQLVSAPDLLSSSTPAIKTSNSDQTDLRLTVLLLDCAWLNSQFNLIEPVQAALRQQLSQANYVSLDWARMQASDHLFQQLWQLALQLQPLHVRLVILLDNFEALWNNGSPQTHADNALCRLTSLASLVLTTSAPLYELEERLGGALAVGATTHLFLGLLEADAVQQWLAYYQQIHPGLNTFVGLLPEMTGGHPFLLRRLGESLAEIQQMLGPGQPLRSQHGSLLRLRLAEYGHPLFVAFWNSLMSLPLARQGVTLGLLERLTRGPLAPDQITREQLPALNWLINQATIRYGVARDGYTYQLFSPLFAEFVLNRRTQQITETGEATVQPINNTEEAIYEQLTKMEAMLLRYFERHSHRLITMEQLLTDVWKRSDASTRRVQEAIRRLRLQLEQYPNIGSIENERGRGYRFIPAP